MKEILDVIHDTIYQFFDVCGDDEEAPMSDKDKLLLEVNKAICNNLKALEQESVLDKIKAEIELKEKTLTDKYGQQKYGIWTDDVLQIIDKYKESEDKG
jgi:hypothetical protein